MISLFKGLYASQRAGSSDEAVSASAEALHQFCSSILDSTAQQVLAGKGFEPLRQRLGEVQNILRAEDFQPDQLIQAAQTFSAVLSEYRLQSRQAAVAQAIEVQHIFAMLNQALIVLAEGRDKSVSRLSEIQGALQRTSLIEDIVALKSALTATVQFVREETAQARALGSEDISRLEREIDKAREFIGNAQIELAGRPEGLMKIAECANSVVPGQAVYAVSYLCDRLHAVKQRYGQAVADEMVFRLIKERLQPVAPVDAIYRWTSAGLVSVFLRRRGLPELQAEIANLNRSPLLHRIALGNRTAVLTMAPSHLVAESLPEASHTLVEQLDKFTGAAG